VSLVFLSDIMPGQRLRKLLDNLSAKPKSPKLQLGAVALLVAVVLGLFWFAFTYVFHTTPAEAFEKSVGLWAAVISAIGAIIAILAYVSRPKEKPATHDSQILGPSP